MKLSVTNQNNKLINYIYNVYRAEYEKKKLSRQISIASKDFGNYIHVSHKDIERVVVCFSKEKGQLLAESIQAYFAYPRTLLYLEKLADNQQYIIIHIHEHHIMLDDIVDLNELTDILSNLEYENTFEIKYYGFDINQLYNDVHLLPNISPIKLDSSVVKTLAPNRRLTLKNQKLALLLFYTSRHPLLCTMLVLIILIIIGFFSYTPTPPKKVIYMPPPVDHYLALKEALSTNALSQSSKILSEFYQISLQLYARGWNIKHINLQKALVSIDLVESALGSNIDINQFAHKHHLTLAYLSDNEVTLQKELVFKKRNLDTLLLFTDNLSHLVSYLHQMPNCTLSLGKRANFNYYQSQQLTINCHDLSANFINNNLLTHLSSYPLVLQTLKLSPKDTLIDLNVSLTLYGT